MTGVNDGQLKLETASPADSEAAVLIDELNTLLDSLYHPDDNHFSLEPEEVTGKRGAFLIARLDGEAVGCGAVRMVGDDRAEIKRMYVCPEARGSRVGAAILERLETEARERGARRLVLEMGPDQPAAERLYTAFGFEVIPCWGEYRATPNSRCLGKDL